ncbi:MAG: hypothetical protein DWQ47_10010 [Acidobacteria bacterium]|nr:MAG: hypothetical protein DWQ32_12425 [Acidobacteriota bacterium]REJ98676.1 MAG: hypothetical protein DWQ38_15055 [Acidobacteriota bacterium]REK16668.1 MAG: hypothetical protein DWQ43_00270 [Acidobacteriota bacterium]REK42579.1 MAG: hypothetical protein DWQ47_10010 [Acidobacteriota bacterium]
MLSAIVLAGSEAYRIFQSIQSALDSERSNLTDVIAVAHKKTALTPQKESGISIWQDFTDTRSIAEFGGSVFAATAGGLVEYSREGGLIRHYTVLDGLPESDLTAVAEFQGSLFIGTRSSGLIEFDGRSMSRYEWPDRDPKAITSLANDSGTRLMIGTFNGGLLSFSGGTFSERTTHGRSIKKITEVRMGISGPVVSTFDNGIWIANGEGWDHLSKENGLPSNRTLGAAISAGRLIVATDLGPAECKDGRCFTRANISVASGIAYLDGSVIISRETGDLFRLGKEIEPFGKSGGPSTNFRVVNLGERAYALGKTGIFEVRKSRLAPFARREQRMAGNFVSSILPLRNGQIWLGNFREGIDVVTDDGRLIKHIESDAVSEVNYVTRGTDGGILAATTSGVFRIGHDFEIKETEVEERSGAVSHIDGEIRSTSKGLLVGAGRNAKRITAEHRLPANSVYTSLKTGGSVLVGTLSGLARVRAGRVEKTWKDSNSGLSTNWVTAITEVNGRIFVGTYGGGIFELAPSDEIRRITPKARGVVVNLNALASDGKRIFAGTMNGLAVFDLGTGGWREIVAGLPSRTVLSVACDDDRLYAGTDSGVAVIPLASFHRSPGGTR